MHAASKSYVLSLFLPPSFSVSLMYPTLCLPFHFSPRSPSTVLLACSLPFTLGSPHFPFIYSFIFPFQSTGYRPSRPPCYPMKIPLKCFPVKMFSIPSLPTLPIHHFHRPRSSSPFPLSLLVSISHLLILPSPSSLCIFESVTRIMA